MTVTSQPKRKGRPPIEFTTKVEWRGVPCPPEHAAAYWEAWRIIGELLREEAKKLAIENSVSNTSSDE